MMLCTSVPAAHMGMLLADSAKPVVTQTDVFSRDYHLCGFLAVMATGHTVFSQLDVFLSISGTDDAPCLRLDQFALSTFVRGP